MKQTLIAAIVMMLSIPASGQSLIDSKWVGPDKAEAGAFSFGGRGDTRSIRFNSAGGLATIQTPVEPGAGPFAVSWEVSISKGRLASWRNSGVAMAVSTGSLEAMKDDDFAIVTAILQQGVRCTVLQGGVYSPYEKRPGVWGFRDKRLAKRYDLSMGGSGGHDYSVRWPGKEVAGTKLRFVVWRDSSYTIRFAIFHAASPEEPWWECSFTLPKNLAKKPLTTLSFRTTNEATFSAKPVPKQITFEGVISKVELRKLKANEAFEPAPLKVAPPAHWVLKKPDAAKHPSVFFTPKTLAGLRKKFNHPAMANYRTLILRKATPPAVDKVLQGSTPGWSSGLTALTWAYVLTGDEAYLPRLLAVIDRMTSATDGLKQKQNKWPGLRRQLLNIDEFNGHNLESLATAYDCIYDKLDAKRRARILRLLNRGLDYYLGRIKAGDWWYRSNPSNTIGVGNGLNGVVALVLRDYRPDDSKKAIDTAVKTIKDKYVGVAEDGGCVEGNMYWNYGMSYPIWFGYALKQVTGDDRGLLTSPQMRNAGNYLKLMYAGDGKFLCFNDTQPWLNGLLICAHSGSANDLPFLRKAADHMAEKFVNTDAFGEQVRGQFAVSAFLGRDLKPAPEKFPDLPTLHIVSSIQEGVLRSDAGLVPSLVTGVKGKGKQSTHHANEDQGSVAVYARGENFLLDPGYFEPAATDHTLPLLGQYVRRKSNDPRAEAMLSDQWESGELRGMTVDSSGAYIPIRAAKDKPASGSVRRIIVQAADKAVIWLDDISVPQAHRSVTTQYQCGFGVKLSADGTRCRIIGADSDMEILVDGPKTKLTCQGRRKFSQEWWVYGKTDVKWHPVRGKYDSDPARPMVTVCTPLAKDAPSPKIRVTRGDNSISVDIGQKEPIVFERVNNRWRAKRSARR